MPDQAVRVLVVDDDPFIRDVLRRFLEDKGFDIATAVDGNRALKAISSYAPDVVLLDIHMPSMSGMECLEQIAAEGTDCGVIMISGDSDGEQARKSLEMGAADYICKPFDLDYLETSLLVKLAAMGRPAVTA